MGFLPGKISYEKICGYILVIVGVVVMITSMPSWFWLTIFGLGISLIGIILLNKHH